MTENSKEREERINSIPPAIASVLADEIGMVAFDVLEQLRDPQEWANDHDSENTLTLSTADAVTVFIALQYLSMYEVEQGMYGGALDAATIAQNVAAQLAAQYAPATPALV